MYQLLKRQRDKVEFYLKQGYTIRLTAKMTGCAIGTVRKIAKELKQNEQN